MENREFADRVRHLLETYAMLLGLSRHGYRDVRLGQALGMATAAIASGPAVVSLLKFVGYPVPLGKIVLGSIFIVLGWLVLAGICVTPATRRRRSIVINLNVASFWIAVSVFLISSAYVVAPTGNLESIRIVLMVTILPILVFVHILKTRYKFRRKFWLILALCATNLPFAVWSVLVS